MKLPKRHALEREDAALTLCGRPRGDLHVTWPGRKVPVTCGQCHAEIMRVERGHG